MGGVKRMKKVFLGYILSCCDKILSQTQLNRTRAHVGSQMTQSIMVGQSEWQKRRSQDIQSQVAGWDGSPGSIHFLLFVESRTPTPGNGITSSCYWVFPPQWL